MVVVVVDVEEAKRAAAAWEVVTRAILEASNHSQNSWVPSLGKRDHKEEEGVTLLTPCCPVSVCSSIEGQVTPELKVHLDQVDQAGGGRHAGKVAAESRNREWEKPLALQLGANGPERPQHPLSRPVFLVSSPRDFFLQMSELQSVMALKTLKPVINMENLLTSSRTRFPVGQSHQVSILSIWCQHSSSPPR